MNKSRLIALGLLTLLASCSSKTESGITKRELSEIMSAVSQKTTNTIMGFSQSPGGDVTVETEAPESFVLRRVSSGWVIVSSEKRQWIAPKKL